MEFVTRHPARYQSDRGVWGCDLRYALLQLLLEANGRAYTVAALDRAVRAHYLVHPAVTRRTVAEALAHECVRGRARRAGRGTYRLAPVSRSIVYRIEQRAAALPRAVAGEVPSAMDVPHLASLGQQFTRW
jgi:hypothetical protein